ncbi:LOW QUALITY PROTEIN: alpha-adducin [Latimeria chalumnae]|uniref:LOW QUALITY PROTEIN: alpha-adducin n=1 Tax=Latimeria chalumnae TaxID=7897 RepID=UPI0006D916F8|nr:PREDICTED: LOW QUALITY PROTEIN: alpha-adducin [Latimeria chalumnae]|eukprot:XP_005998239.2 PREDICTED: LOW QUALITY PROTEIN: alpha-adducin [Latimeria chalumnae]
MNGDSGAGVVTSPPLTTAPHKEKYFDRIDENNPEYLRERNMAPDLRQDFNMMEQRKRVSMILQSPAFCEDLESMIQEQLKKGKNPTSLLALQQIADFMTTNVPNVYPPAPQGGMAALNMSLGMVTPVNDLRGSDSVAYDKGEKLLRCKLAAFYRLADLFGWSQLIYNHITVRINAEQEHFLIVPFGLLYSEVTASSLVKINLQGDIIDRGSTNLGVNKAGFTLHSAIYAARPDVKCIVHIHTPAGAAVSAMRCGLLPISPQALSLGEVSYHDYHGILVDEEEKVLIQKNLGPKSKVLILRNHGLVSVGETVEEAFYYIHNLVAACEIQVRTLASAGGPDNLVLLDPGKYKAKSRSPESPTGEANGSHPKWLVGEQEFEALMRMLDNLGYRTGYPYRCPALREKAKKYSDVEVPPSAMGYSFANDSDSGTRSPLRHSFQKQQREKTRWLNSSRGEDVSEDTQNGSSPKSKTKWTKEDGQRLVASAPNQFVPLNTNPKEVQEMRNKIREQNLQDIKTAGPQSLVLTGVVLDRSFVQGELVTASKAIIEKEYQPKVIVSTTGPNPFNKFSEQELEEYRMEVERKQKGSEAEVSKGTETVALNEGQAEQLEATIKPQFENYQEQVTSFDFLHDKDLTDGSSLVHTSEVKEANVDPLESKEEPRETESFHGQECDPVQITAPNVEQNDKFPDLEDTDPLESPHREFHTAVIKALNSNPDLLSETSGSNLWVHSEPAPEEAKDASPADPTPTRTPPSTPNKLEEESQQEQTYKDDSDAATLRQTLPDLTPDEPSEALVFPTSGKEEEEEEAVAAATVLTEVGGQNEDHLAKPQNEPVAAESQEPQAQSAEEATPPVAEEAAVVDPGSDESPGKSPSKEEKVPYSFLPEEEQKEERLLRA